MSNVRKLRNLYHDVFRNEYCKTVETMRDDGKIDLPEFWDFYKPYLVYRRFTEIVQDVYRKFAGLDEYHRFAKLDISFANRMMESTFSEFYYDVCQALERAIIFGD